MDKKIKIALISAGAVVAAAAIGAVATEMSDGGNQQHSTNSPGSIQQQGNGNSVTNNTMHDDRRPHTEIADSRAGVPVYSDWADASNGDRNTPRIAMRTTVEVACMIRNDNLAMGSIHYWYKLSSGPYSGRWAPSDDFANGDPVGVTTGEAGHDWDTDLPLCTN